MTGSLQIKGNKYYVVLNIKDEFGKPKSKWVSTKIDVKGNNKKKAKEKMQEILINYAYLDNCIDTDVKFTDFVLNWISKVEKNAEINYITLREYKKVVNLHIIPYFKPKNLKLTAITSEMLETYLRDEFNNGRLDGKGGLSANTVRQYRNVLSSIFKEAVKRKLLVVNPCRCVKLPKQNNTAKTKKYYTPEQLQKLFDTIKDNYYYPIIFVTALYGLRCSEVCGLRWSAIDFDKKLVEINHTIANLPDEMCERDTTKTKSSHRVYPLLPEIEKLLLQVKARQEHYKMCFGNNYIENDYVFTKKDGELIKPKSISSSFTHLLDKYGLEHIRFHDLRHSCASLLINQGMPLKMVADWLGHSQISTTADIYGHLYLDTKQSIANEINKVFAF